MSLVANQDYWNGKPQIDRINILNMHFNFTYNVNALLTGKIDATRFAPKPYEYELVSIRNDPSLIYQEASRTNIRWIFMNNKKINVTMRKAISYAINHSIIEYLNRTREKTPVPESIVYHNATGITVPYYNLSLARQTLIDANWNGTAGLTANEDISPGNEWEVIANSSYPLATYNFTYIIGFYDVEIIKDFIPQYLKQIGIKVVSVGIPGGQYWSRVYEVVGYHRNMFEISVGFWGADYNDPYNLIDPFYSNKEINYNAAQVNDTLAELWMDQALEETNPTVRRQLYYQIQKRLVEEVFATTCLYSQQIADVYSANIAGWHSNNFLMPFKNIYYNA
jgi:ABC-type transport system substrate-binding protein